MSSDLGYQYCNTYTYRYVYSHLQYLQSIVKYSTVLHVVTTANQRVTRLEHDGGDEHEDEPLNEQKNGSYS